MLLFVVILWLFDVVCLLLFVVILWLLDVVCLLFVVCHMLFAIICLSQGTLIPIH